MFADIIFCCASNQECENLKKSTFVIVVVNKTIFFLQSTDFLKGIFVLSDF